MSQNYIENPIVVAVLEDDPNTQKLITKLLMSFNVETAVGDSIPSLAQDLETKKHEAADIHIVDMNINGDQKSRSVY